MALKNLLIIIFLVILGACSKKNGTVPVKLKFFKSGLASSGSLNGGIILMGQSEDGLESFRVGIASPSQDFSLDLKRGKWDFTAVGWSGEAGIMTGQTRCAYSADIDLKETDASVNLNLTESRCLSTYGKANHTFSESDFRLLAGGFKTLQPVLCFNETLNLANCSTTSNDSIYKSFKVIYSSEKKGELSNKLSDLSSACNEVGSTPVLTLPIGDDSGSSPLGFKVVFYPSLNCSGTSLSENFNTSFKNGVTGSSLRGLESSTNNNNLFINLGIAAESNEIKINSKSIYTNSRSVNVSFPHLKPEIEKICFSELINGADCLEASWITALASPKIVTLSIGEGVKTLYLFSKNSSEVIELFGQDSIELKFDTPAPVISSLQLISNATMSNTLSLILNSVVSGMPDKMCFNETPSAVGCVWTNYIAKSTYLLTPGEGARTVYMHVQNLAGNITSFNKSVTIDTMAPTVPGVASVNTFYKLGELPFSLNWGASTDVNLNHYDMKICGASDCSTRCGAVRSTPGLTPSNSVSISDGAMEGINHICIRAIDTFGNQSTSTSVASFTYDTIAPISAGITLVLANGNPFTNTRTINWVANGAIDANQICISESSTALACSPWIGITNSSVTMLPNTEGLHTLYAFYKDAAQNISLPVIKNITLDTIVPAPVIISSPLTQMDIEGNKIEFSYYGGFDTNFQKVVARLCSDNNCTTVYATSNLGMGAESSSLTAAPNTWPINTQAVVVLKSYDLAGNFSTVASTPVITRTFNLRPKEMAFGETHTCFAFSNGSAKCMGLNSNGQLGLGNTTSFNGTTPSAMGNNLASINFDGLKIKNISAGGNSTCAILSNSQLSCWGANSLGQLGLGDIVQRMSPTLVDLGPSLATQVAISETHTCIVDHKGDLKCFGNNQYNQLGLEHTNSIGVAPSQMGFNLGAVNLGTGKKVIKVGVGNGFSCVLLSDRTVKCWGKNEYGQLGLDHTLITGVEDSQTINFGTLEGVLDLSVGHNHSCVLLVSGKTKCWGRNEFGQLGVGTTTNHGTSAGSMAALLEINFGSNKKAIQIAAGYSTTCAVLEDGSSRCWGFNINGVAGQGNQDLMYSPSALNLNLGTGTTVRSIDSNGVNACAILTNGQVKCWGTATAHGQGVPQTLGILGGQMGDALPYVKLGTANVLDPMKIVSGSLHSCALMYNGLVKCWGANSYGQLGMNIPGGYKGLVASDMGENLPFLEFGGSKYVRDIASGGFGSNSTCALLTNGEMKCWGRNLEGQLGISQRAAPKDIIGDDADEVSASMPAISFPSFKKVRSINLGSATTCAVMIDGSVYCFGENSMGQCGIENSTPSIPNPVLAVMLDEKVIEMTLGQIHSCALTASGSTKCWGAGMYGQLGNNLTSTIGDSISSMSTLSAVDMGSLAKAIKIDAGKYSTCALLDNRLVKCWGNSTNGVLGQNNEINIGNGTGISVSSAQSVSFMPTVNESRAIDVQTNGETTCVLMAINNIRCWGHNFDGILGQNSMIPNLGTASNPIASNIVDSVLGGVLFSVEKLTVGMNVCAISVSGPGVCWGSNYFGQVGQGAGLGHYGTSERPVPLTPINL